MNEPSSVPEVRVRDVALALLNLTPSERHAAIRPLIAMLERVVAGGEPHPTDRDLVPEPALHRRDGSAETLGR